MIPISFPNFDEHQYQPYFINNFSYSYPPLSFEQNLPIIYYLPSIPHWTGTPQISSSNPSHPLELKESDCSVFEPEYQGNVPA